MSEAAKITEIIERLIAKYHIHVDDISLFNDIQNEAYDVGVYSEKTRDKWIDISERKPKEKERCLVWNPYLKRLWDEHPYYGPQPMQIYEWRNGAFNNEYNGGEMNDCIYWQPLPEPQPFDI